MGYERGVVVKGPDLFAGYEFRPYVCVSDETHPFSDEEALYVAATTTQRDAAFALNDADFATGGLPRDSSVNPWTVVSIRHADIDHQEGQLTAATIEEIATEAAGYLGVR